MVTLRALRTFGYIFSLLVTTSALAAESGNGDTPSSRSVPTQADREEAQQRYKRGVEQFKNGVYDAALIEFRRAYALAPSYKILYNIGQVSRQLDDYASAVEAFRRYLREGGSNIPAARDTEVKAELEKLSGRVGTLDITATPEQAEITIDDLAIGKAPVRGALVNAGRRRISASLPGYTPQSRVIDLAGGETAKLTFDFTPPTTDAAKPTATQAVAAQSTDETKPTHTVALVAHTETPAAPAQEARPPWLLWGGATLLAAGAVTTGVLSLRASSEIDDLKRKPVSDSQAYDHTHSRMFGFAVATDVLTGLAVATSAVALYFTLSSPSSERVTAVGISPTSIKINCVF